MISMEQLSGTCYTKGMRKKEISTFTTVMEKHMVKTGNQAEDTPAEKISRRMCWERMCSIWARDHEVFLPEF